MKKAIKILIMAFFILLLPLTVSAQQKLPIVYVAIGDSLAAGQTPNREIDTGYSDLIAQELSRHMPTAFFSKNLSFPGYTSNDVLSTVKSEEAQELLNKANLITVSVGANDLLQLVRHDVRGGNLSFQEIQADFALNAVRLNMGELLDELKVISPDAEIYVMGYYFPYPYVKESQQAGIAKQLDRLNKVLEQVAEKGGAHFVPVSKGFEQVTKASIPNPADVHPNMEGYRKMANSFFEVMAGGRFNVSRSELPLPSPKTFEEMAEQLKQTTDSKTANRFTPPNLYVMIKELHHA